MHGIKGGKMADLHRLMLFPAFIVFLAFVIIPIFQGMALAFTDWDGYNPIKFIWFENFVRLFSDDQAHNALKNTVICGVFGTLLLNLLGLAYALVLDSKIRLKGLLRTIVYLPAIISPLIIGYIWLIILSSEKGMIISALQALGFENSYHDWLADPQAAIWIVILVHAWQYLGGNMIIYLAGLQNIPVELFESARIDGAGYLQELGHIKLPLLIPSFRINIITNIIGAMSMFDVIMSLTGGGPGHYTESLSIFIYRLSTSNQAGYTSAAAMVMFIIILIPAALAYRIMSKADVEA